MTSQDSTSFSYMVTNAISYNKWLNEGGVLVMHYNCLHMEVQNIITCDDSITWTIFNDGYVEENKKLRTIKFTLIP